MATHWVFEFLKIWLFEFPYPSDRFDRSIFFVKGKIRNDDLLLIDQALNLDLVHLFFYVIPLQK